MARERGERKPFRLPPPPDPLAYYGAVEGDFWAKFKARLRRYQRHNPRRKQPPLRQRKPEEVKLRDWARRHLAAEVVELNAALWADDYHRLYRLAVRVLGEVPMEVKLRFVAVLKQVPGPVAPEEDG